MTQQGRTKESSHVHFDSAQLSKDHDSEISVEEADANTRIIHLGFLKLHHTYLVEFDVDDGLVSTGDAKPSQNKHVQLMKFQPNASGTGHHVAITLHAYKDKLLREKLVMEDGLGGGEEQRSLTLVLLARVLGKHKGTPSLKTGIRCIGASSDASSSDEDEDH